MNRNVAVVEAKNVAGEETPACPRGNHNHFNRPISLHVIFWGYSDSAIQECKCQICQHKIDIAWWPPFLPQSQFNNLTTALILCRIKMEV